MKKIKSIVSVFLCITFTAPISVMGADLGVLMKNQTTALGLYEILSNNISDSEYGGTFLDENLNLVVNVLEGMNTMRTLEHSNDVIYRTVTYSITDLGNARDLLLDALLDYNSSQNFVISRNLMENRMEVLVPKITKELVNKLESIGLPSDIFVIREEEFSRDAAAVEDRTFDINEDVDYNSLSTIDVINGDMFDINGFWGGSVGVGAVMTQADGRRVYGFLTHGHGEMSIGSQMTYRNQHIGNVSMIQKHGNVDASFTPISTDQARTIRITNQFLDGSTFTSFGFNPPVGTQVTRYGSTIFSSTGPIVDNDATLFFGDGTLLHNMVITQLNSAPGDSGGPNKAMDSNGVYHIVGIQSASNPFTGQSAYVNILNIMDAFNVQPIAKNLEVVY